jgi:MSHA biogenesis protein MshQ
MIFFVIPFLIFLALPSLAVAETAFFETGSVTVSDSIDSGNWETVMLRERYTNPVVIVGPVTHNNDRSLSARVRNVTASSFELGFQSPCESVGDDCEPSGGWSAETIRYWVVEEGVWEFPDGTKLEAGRLTTSDVRSRGGSTWGLETVTFRQAFTETPGVLHSVNSFNDSDWIASSAWESGNDTGNPPDTSGMTLALEGAEVFQNHGSEVIGWVAIEPASGTNNGHSFVAGRLSSRDVDRHEDSCDTYALSGFGATPDLVASHNSMAGTNGGWLRFCGGELSASDFSVHIDEDQVNDSERTGLEEAIGWFAFESDSSGTLTRPDTFCSGVNALFCDDFDTGTLLGDGWTVNEYGDGQIDITGNTSSSPPASLSINGGEVVITSPAFDLSGATTVSLDYWWRRGGDSFSESPDNNEDLYIQYLDQWNNWRGLETLQGRGQEGEAGQSSFELPSDALHSGFRFRFLQWRGSGSNYDYWHIDNVVLQSRSFTCQPENFNRTGLGADWVTDRSNGSFTPQIINNRLRMTEAVGNQATAATYQRTFPGADNLIQVEFDYYAYGGSGADGLAVVFSDASVTPQAGGYGGSLGYAQEPDGSGGFAGGWLGIGLDEYGNFANDNEGRQGGDGFTPDAVTIRGAEPSYAYIADSGQLPNGIDSNSDNNPYRYRITIDSRNNQTPQLTVERRGRGTGNRFDLLIRETLSGQPPIPENMFLSLTGSTGGANNIHELDNLQICADKIGPVQNLVDHFEIVHSGTGLTCSPEAVTIRACDNADCSQQFPDPVEVTMSPSGWVGGDTFTFTGSTTAELRVTSPGTVTLAVPTSDPGTKAFSDTLCDNGSGPLSANNCDMTFFDSGFDISVPDHVSDTLVPATIAAVRKDPVTEQCIPGFSNVTKPVALWSDYVNPSSGSLDVYADGTAIPASQGGTTSLTFDGNGVATTNIRYPDVGRVRLHARYDGTGDEAGLLMLGDSTFVARPDHFELFIPNNDAATSVANGNDFVAAGAGFEVQVSSINASGNVTPNFGQEVTPESVDLTEALVAPSGGDLPPLTGAFGNFGEDCNGNASTAGTACGLFRWPEVGIISLMPSLASGSYLATENVEGNEEPYVGRFIPDQFKVVVSEPGEVASYCSVTTAFAYMGQGLSWKNGLQPALTLEALSVPYASGPPTRTRTRNYTLGDFQRLSAADLDPNRSPGSSDVTAVDVDGNPFPVSTSLNGGSLSVLDPGRLEYRFAPDDEVTYSKTPKSRVPSFTPDYRIELTDFSDADGVSSPQLPVAIPPVFGLDMRYGRLQMENAYGPETSGLEIPFQAEYYTSGGFVLNAADGCWAYNTADVSLDQSGLSGGSTSVSALSDTLSGGVSPPGRGVLLEAPGAENRGDVIATFAVPLWLQGDFNDDGSLEDPSSRATFGVYRGNDRIIYWQEVLN